MSYQRLSIFAVALISSLYLIQSVKSVPVEDSQLTSDKNIALLQEECNNICNDCGCIGFYCGDECLCECYNGQLDEERLKDIASRKFQYVILIQSENGTKLLSNGEDVKGVELIDTVEDEDIFSTNMLREKRDAPPPPPPPPASGPIVSQPIASQPKDVEPIVGHAAPAEEGGAGLLKLKLPAIKAINVKEKFLEWKARAAAAAGAIAIKKIAVPIAFKKIAFTKGFALGKGSHLLGSIHENNEPIVADPAPVPPPNAIPEVHAK